MNILIDISDNNNKVWRSTSGSASQSTQYERRYWTQWCQISKLLPHVLAGEVVLCVCVSVCEHSHSWTTWPSTLIFCMEIGLDASCAYTMDLKVKGERSISNMKLSYSAYYQRRSKSPRSRSLSEKDARSSSKDKFKSQDHKIKVTIRKWSRSPRSRRKKFKGQSHRLKVTKIKVSLPTCRVG